MAKSLAIIELPQLTLAFIPVLAVLFIQFKWSLSQKKTIHALVRMLVQLLLVGFVLSYIFESSSAWLVLILLIIMVLLSSWIALNNIEIAKRQLFQKAVLAIALSGVFTLGTNAKENNLNYIFIAIISSVVIYFFNDLSLVLGKTEKLPVEVSAWMPIVIIFIFSAVGVIYANQK